MNLDKLVAIFADGLGFHYTRKEAVNVAFSQVFKVVIPLRTMLGFSIGLIPSIWTSSFPREHGYWSEFYYESPHSVDLFKISRIQWGIETMALFGIKRTQLLLGRKSRLYPGVPRVVSRLFSRSALEFKEPFTSKDVTSLFAVLNEEKISCNYLFRERITESDIQAVGESDITVFHLGEFDKYGHSYGAESKVVFDKIFELMDALKRISRKAELLLFSDHGMFSITATWDILKLFSKTRSKLGKDYLVFLDATMARFWFFNKRAEEEISQLLSRFPYGHFISVGEMSSNGIDFCHNAFGDKIFLLHPGFEIYPNFYHPFYKNLIRGMHGYSPSASNSFALFSSTVGDVTTNNDHDLLDIAPTIARFLKIRTPSNWNGSSILQF